MSKSLQASLDLRHPIIQAPMAGVSTARMAAAASNAGALGSLGLGANTAEQARQILAETRVLTDRPFSVNFFCHRPAQADPVRDDQWAAHLAPYFQEFGAQLVTPLKEIYKSFIVDGQMQELMLELKPAAVSFHFGLPDAQLIAAYRKAGIYLMATATTLDEARQIEAAGIDAVVAQGIEAGGHRGVFDTTPCDLQMSTLALVQLLYRHIDLPIIAAGGIMDGRGMAAAELLGAAAFQLGTAFVLSAESAASAAYKSWFKSERAGHTQVTAAISGRSARGMVNRFMREVGGANLKASDYPTAYDAGKQLHALATQHGSDEFGAFWAGQGAPLARAMDTAELVETLAREYLAARSAGRVDRPDRPA